VFIHDHVFNTQINRTVIDSQIMSLSQLQNSRAMGQPDEQDVTEKTTGIRSVILAV
jgi:hypothetical protein